MALDSKLIAPLQMSSILLLKPKVGKESVWFRAYQQETLKFGVLSCGLDEIELREQRCSSVPYKDSTLYRNAS